MDKDSKLARSIWHKSIISIIQLYPKGTKFTSDKVRVDTTLQHIGPPDHANSWGSVFCAAGKGNLIRRTGRSFRSTVPTNNGRPVAEWERI